MKLLIIAGPYEADRIRKASLAAGFETVAVEPGESLSGWITASRPELIVMAPQIVHPDPALALAKVRAVPRGRVPIFLVGDESDEARMRDLADGFFVRPVAPALLLERARAILAPNVGAGAGPGSRRGSAPSERTEMGLGPLPAVPSPAPAPGSGGINAENEFSRGGRTPKSGPHGGRPTLKPLVASAGAASSARPDSNAFMAELDAGIDALFDAELSAAVSTSAPARPQKSGPIAAGQVPVRPPTKAVARPERPLAPPAKPDFEDETTKKVQASLLGAALQASGGERTRARLLERYAPVEDGDYFAVLGVSRDAGPEELRRAHARLLQEIAPDVVGPPLADELTAQIVTIRLVAAEALRVLSDDRLRARYAAHLPALSAARSAGQAPGPSAGQLRK